MYDATASTSPAEGGRRTLRTARVAALLWRVGDNALGEALELEGWEGWEGESGAGTCESGSSC